MRRDRTFEGFFNRIAMINDHPAGLFALKRKARDTLRVPIQDAVREKRLVIGAVPRRFRRQNFKQIRGEVAPLRSGDDRCLAPAAFVEFRQTGKVLFPPHQRGVDPVALGRNTQVAPIGAEFHLVGSVMEIESNIVAFDENPWRFCRGRREIPPFIEGLLL